MSSTKRRSRVMIAGLVVLTALIAGISGAYASHQFADVPDSNPHHDTIAALVNSGIATGFTGSACTNAGTTSPCYLNQNNITRGSSADQFARGLSRIDEGDGTNSNTADDTFVNIGTAAIRAGGIDSSHTGFIRVDARVYATHVGAECPCFITVRVHNDNTNTNTEQVTSVLGPCVIFVHCGTVNFTDVFPAGNTTAGNTFQVQGEIHTSGSNTGVSLDGSIVAEYIPFGGDPTNV